ncbi:auxilin-related protein 1-like [Prunus yedoensis var. nudiflora]|uniref:Auxilin-related protein 1-like n=1 Tax=Prunus yedoensis var. nudiflora TaxID=2094558 RepID=A0A314UJX9_PRUYE|nr:auxilin-related protein 1-like [Prunus yedoensis var. nudiflora]
MCHKVASLILIFLGMQVLSLRIAETLDVEIKRWAAGKEGNLRALLSTMQYVLWPECGWQPVSLTDMITAASVKKKYIAEKVFDLLKEAWNKFNSEELF